MTNSYYQPNRYLPNPYGGPGVYAQPQYQGYGNQYMQPRDGIIRVTGMEGARAFQMPPNSREALFDDTDDVVIIKVTDGAGFPSFKRAKLLWLDDSEKQQPNEEYLTKAEFLKWTEEHENGQYTVQRRRSRVAENESADPESDNS